MQGAPGKKQGVRIIPDRWRLPLKLGALLCLIFPAVVPGADRDRSATAGTLVGTLLSVDRERRICTLEKSQGIVDTFRLDDDTSLVFQGMRLLQIDELRPGMRVEIDHRRMAGDELPAVTWVEVLEEKH
jgi:hypothetical protein